MVSCIRFLGITDFSVIDRMTFPEYQMLMKGARLHQLDEEYRIAQLAWQCREVNAKKKTGNKLYYIYDRFDKFFDYKKMESKILGEEEKTEEDAIKERYKEFLRSQQNE